MPMRRKFPPEFKVKVALELLRGEKSAAEASRAYGVKAEVLARWKTEFLERAPQVFAAPEAHDQHLARIAELERLVGRLTLELEVAKKSPAW
jgi:transposase